MERHEAVESESGDRRCAEKPPSPSTVTVISQLGFKSNSRNEMKKKENSQRTSIGVVESCSLRCSAGLDFSGNTGVNQNATIVGDNSLDLHASVSQRLSKMEISADHEVVGSAAEDNHHQSIEQIDNLAEKQVAAADSSMALGKMSSLFLDVSIS